MPLGLLLLLRLGGRARSEAAPGGGEAAAAGEVSVWGKDEDGGEGAAIC